jgi:predicted dehydrogenase
MLNVGVIGCGYWGPNLVRNFAELDCTRVLGVSDLRPERLTMARRRHTGLRTVADYHELMLDPAIEALAIATPVSSHYELALEALRAGKHVLVEKPLTTTSRQASHLISEAAERKLTLMVDHTFVYTGAVLKIRELVAQAALGDLYYYDSVRINLGLFQSDVNVLWDLAAHDLSIMDYVLPSRPIAVSATGSGHVPGKPENIAYMTVFFADSLIAHIHVNWLAPVKIRRTLISGSLKMIVYDDLEPSEKLKVYDRGITLGEHIDSEQVRQMRVSYRTGDMWSPQLDMTEALRREISHFADCVQTGQVPITDGAAGRRVVRILEAATRSMAARGQLVNLEPEVSSHDPIR